MFYTDFHSMKGNDLHDWQKECFACVNALSSYKNAPSWNDIPKDILLRAVKTAYAYVTIRSFLENIRSFPVKRAVYLLSAYLNEALAKSGFKSDNLNVDKHINDNIGQPVIKRENNPSPQSNIDFDRPKHLSEYDYMLPDELKSDALAIPELYLRLADLRQQIEIIVAQYEKNKSSDEYETPGSVQSSLSQLAKDCIDTEQKIRSFWNLVDKSIEFFNDNNRPPLINEINPEFTPKTKFIPVFASLNKRPTEFTKEEIDKISDPAQQEYFKRKRIVGNKSYLNRTDIVATDEWRNNMKLRHKELLEWGVRITPRMNRNLNRAYGNEE